MGRPLKLHKFIQKSHLATTALLLGFALLSVPAAFGKAKTVVNPGLTTLYGFCADHTQQCDDGNKPLYSGALVLQGKNTFYGTTYFGGAHSQGVIFEISTQTTPPSEKTLYSFCASSNCADGSNPDAGVILDSSGNLYGTTLAGGAYGGGTVFELTSKSPNAYSVLHSFGNASDGAKPAAALLFDSKKNLYGTTMQGGQSGGGTVFELEWVAKTKTYTESLIYSFCGQANCADGQYPYGSLVMDKNDDLFGTTAAGGANGGGTVFELVWDAKKKQYIQSVLWSFCSLASCADGSQPVAGLVMDKKGALYGTTMNHGIGGGTVFRLSPPAKTGPYVFTVLYSFCSTDSCFDGRAPRAGLAMDKSGNLFGTTSVGGSPNRGILFELPATSYQSERMLYSFCVLYACTDGAYPWAGVVIDSSGNLFGTTGAGGGGFDGFDYGGAVFQWAP